MNRRIGVIVALGAFAIAAIHFGSRRVIWQNRYKPHSEFVREESIAATRAELEAMLAKAESPERKTLIGFWMRTADPKAMNEARARFRGSDGLDQFEAWLAATAYFVETFGVCGTVDLPRKVGAAWQVATTVGTPGRPASVQVDGASGRITCTGQPTITYADGFRSSTREPN